LKAHSKIAVPKKVPTMKPSMNVNILPIIFFAQLTDCMFYLSFFPR